MSRELGSLATHRAYLKLPPKQGSVVPFRMTESKVFRIQVKGLEKRLRALNQKTESLKQQRDSVLDQYEIASEDAHIRFDPLAIYKARKDIRPEKEDEIKDKLWDEYGNNYSLFMLADSTRQARDLLGEEVEEHRLERELRKQEKELRRQEDKYHPRKPKDDWER